MEPKVIAEGSYADCHAATPKGVTLAVVAGYGKPPPGCTFELIEQTDGSYAIRACKGQLGSGKELRQPVMREVRRELASGAVVLHHSIAPEHFEKGPGAKFFLEHSGEAHEHMRDALAAEGPDAPPPAKRKR